MKLMNDVKLMLYLLGMTLGMWKWWNYLVFVVTMFGRELLCEKWVF